MMRSIRRVVLMAALTLWAQVAGAAEITVSAAVSLTNVFSEIGKEFEKASQGRHKVYFNFGASGSLLQQIARGAPVDVFASADMETMDRAEKQNLLFRDSRQNFAANRLVVAVPAKSTLALSSLADMIGADVQRIAVGIPDSVPVGRYTKGILETVGLWEPLQRKVIFAQSVRQCLDYVARGEVDAGFVYATDAQLMPDKVRSSLVVPTQKPILYPIAAVKGNGQESAARAFVSFVRADLTARRILTKYGFLEP